MYTIFFAGYNKMLRNNLVKVEGCFDLKENEILSYGMYAAKLLDGQKLLPVSLRYEVGRKVRCQSAAFYAIKDYTDGQTDVPTVIPEPSFKWRYDDSAKDAAVDDVQEEYQEVEVTAGYNDDYSKGEKSFFMPAPQSAGLVSAAVTRTIDIGYWSTYIDEHRVERRRFNVIESREITTYFRSVAAS